MIFSAEQKGTELRVDLSAAYSTLSGVGLSLADYAITLTLTQLPDVARVRITVAGRDLDYRSRQVFLARDILTVPKEDVVGTVDASLYFVNGDGVLTAEARTLNLYEGDRSGSPCGFCLSDTWNLHGQASYPAIPACHAAQRRCNPL